MIMELIRVVEAPGSGGPGAGEGRLGVYWEKRSAACRRAVGKMLQADPQGAMLALFDATVEALDEEWCASERSYMLFNEVLRRVRQRVSVALRRPGTSSPVDFRAALLPSPAKA
mmetsp:Transcript_50253/g.132059  ORF Transcript_50253/g.132059 Transcript_50253/m.132059 type:complete len:114 (-) Transcript_50253:16-357(-)